LVRLSLLLILLIAFALRLHELTRQDIWWDEARNIEVALRPFFDIPYAPELDIHPPIYFWLLHFWGRLNDIAIGDTPQVIAFITRYLSVAMGLTSLALLYTLTRIVVDKFTSSSSAPLCAVIIGAFSPFWLAESQETRMYTLGFALLIRAAYHLLKLIDSADQPKQWNAALDFATASAVTLVVHYNAIFILVTWYIWWGFWALLRSDRWRQLRTIVMAGGNTLFLLTPFMAIAWDQISDYANPNLGIPTLADYLQQNWRAYLGGYAFDPTLIYGNGMVWLWGCLGLLVVGLWLSIRVKTESSRDDSVSYAPLIFLSTWLIGGLALYYIAVLDRGAFNVRYSSFVTPALYSLMGIAVASLARIWQPLTAVGIAAIMIGFQPV